MHFKRLKRFGYIHCIVTIDDLISRSEYELFKKLVTHGIPYIICCLHIVQKVICVIVVIFSSCLNMLQTCIRNLLSFKHHINMFNKIAGPALLLCFVCMFLKMF